MTINAGFSSAIFYAGWLVVTGVIRHVIRRAIRYRTLKLCCATSRLAHCIAIGNKSAHNTLISFIIRYEVLTSNYANNMAALNSSHRCIKKRALFFFFWFFFLLSLSLSLPFFFVLFFVLINGDCLYSLTYLSLSTVDCVGEIWKLGDVKVDVEWSREPAGVWVNGVERFTHGTHPVCKSIKPFLFG